MTSTDGKHAKGTVIVTLKSSIATDLKDFNINHTIM